METSKLLTNIISIFSYFFKKQEKLINPEHTRMLADIKKYGSEQKGCYRNINWHMTRPYDTYWCGYIKCDWKLTEIDFENLHNLSHGGLTTGIGFDCAHYNDYCPFDTVNTPSYSKEEVIYRDHNYVKKKLYNMIDYITYDMNNVIYHIV
jgi:hypothetical protein